MDDWIANGVSKNDDIVVENNNSISIAGRTFIVFIEKSQIYLLKVLEFKQFVKSSFTNFLLCEEIDRYVRIPLLVYEYQVLIKWYLGSRHSTAYGDYKRKKYIWEHKPRYIEKYMLSTSAILNTTIWNLLYVEIFIWSLQHSH